MTVKYAPITSKIMEELENIVGPGNVLNQDFDRVCYSLDHSPVRFSKKFEYMPEVVVLPETTEQVAEIVHMANKERIPITPRGGATGIGAHVMPIYGGIVLDMKKMDKILELDEDNMLVVVQPGIVNWRLDQELHKRGYVNPHDPGSSPASTIGGAVATGGVGYRSSLYGPLTDQILGLEVVIPNGEVIRVGLGTGSTKISKSSTGYDLKSLFVGSFGTLGVVTEVTLKIHPMPEAEESGLVGFRGFEEALDAAQNIRKLELPGLVIFVVYDEPSIETHKTLGVEYPPEAKAINWFVLSGTKEVVDTSRSKIIDISKQYGGWELPSETAKEYYADRHDGYVVATTVGKGILGPGAFWNSEETPIPASKALEYRNKVLEIAKKYDVRLVYEEIWFGDPQGVGNDVFLEVDESNEDKWADYMAACREITREAVALGGSICSCIGFDKRKYMRHDIQTLKMELGPALDVMRAIKKALDPNNIMNPGEMGLNFAYEDE